MAELILAEQTLSFVPHESASFYVWAAESLLFELVEGETYTIIWDGAPFTATAKQMELNGATGIGMGNEGIVGIGDDNTQPFIFAYLPDYGMNACYTTDTDETNTVAIYKGVLEDETDEPTEPEVIAPEQVNLVLYDRNGDPVTYSGIKTVTFNTDIPNTTATFSLGTAPDETTVVLDLKEGDQVVQNTETGLIKKAVIQKPEGLAPENIKKGVEIAGVEGELIGTGVTKEVGLNDLDLSGGSDSVLADTDTLMSEVVITAPEELTPSNIAKGVEIAGVTGNAKLSDFDETDTALRYMSYKLDQTNKQVVVTSISDKITSINIPDQMGNYTTVVDVYFRNQVYNNPFIPNKVTSVNIGENVKFNGGSMSNFASSCYMLNSPITIPNGVTNISYMMQGCFNFNQPVTIPDTVTNMYAAFHRCNNLNQPVVLGNGDVNMYQAFAECANIRAPMRIPTNIVNMTNAFLNCTHLNVSEPVVLDKVVSMARAFYRCSYLNQPVTVGENVTNMANAFYGCSRLSELTIRSTKLNTYGAIWNMLARGSYTIRLNVYVPAGSDTENIIRNTVGVYSVFGASVTWTEDAANNCFYNTAKNTYIYNTL